MSIKRGSGKGVEGQFTVTRFRIDAVQEGKRRGAKDRTFLSRDAIEMLRNKTTVLINVCSSPSKQESVTAQSPVHFNDSVRVRARTDRNLCPRVATPARATAGRTRADRKEKKIT
ncbi:hypothetical protein NPIL_605261 [Nephila pilipes]|uniref:Uncharacterized protein n=1 Tax=Nephila pilipes TaxID=299642 RepID=A0A8X6Q4W5_NEPPI|nr:hypothetical protein NPIL_605261 [Nephila pilipes]